MSTEVARVGGRLLALATSAIARLREAPKPLHPYGETWAAHITRTGAPDHPTGVPWLDTTGEDDAVVRLSEGVGLPRGWPDVLGLAVRVPREGSPADVLLATTGSGPLGRFVPLLTRTRQGRTFSTLMPYRGPNGPVVLAARARSPRTFDLAHAAPTGVWHRFGRLELLHPVDADPSFDPMGNRPEGLDHYGWMRLLRAPAYRTARASRGEATTTD